MPSRSLRLSSVPVFTAWHRLTTSPSEKLQPNGCLLNSSLPCSTVLPSQTGRNGPGQRANDQTSSPCAISEGCTTRNAVGGSLLSKDSRRTEEHPSEIPSLMRHQYADFCVKK